MELYLNIFNFNIVKIIEMISPKYDLYSVFKMANSWKDGEIIYDKDENYLVVTRQLSGKPVRFLTLDEDTAPIGVILHLFGRGDWVWFDPAYLSTAKSMIPTILNNWTNFQGSTEEETVRIRNLLSCYAQVGQEFMGKIR